MNLLTNTDPATVHGPAAQARGGRQTSGDAPVIDVVIPVYNEAAIIESSIRRLHQFLTSSFPFTWQITIADNASTDDTLAIARSLTSALPAVRVIHLEQKGRGRALRAAWLASTSEIVAYMDVDLSTDLRALLPIVAPLVSGHSDLAIGSRLSRDSTVARGPKREVISRMYNLILRGVFGVRFRDAQCGFKAIRSDVAKLLVPEVVDNAWFFDTELLLLAERSGLRVHEVPVDWVDDPDSRVNVRHTAAADLRGVARVARRFWFGSGSPDVGAMARPELVDDFGRQLVSFALVGTVSTLVSLAFFLALRHPIGAGSADAAALTATTFGNTWANRRFTFVQRGRADRTRHYVGGTLVYLVALALSIAAIAGARTAGIGQPGEIIALVASWIVASVMRFVLLRKYVFRRQLSGGAG
jgi:putative flippase GtrA